MDYMAILNSVKDEEKLGGLTKEQLYAHFDALPEEVRRFAFAVFLHEVFSQLRFGGPTVLYGANIKKDFTFPDIQRIGEQLHYVPFLIQNGPKEKPPQYDFGFLWSTDEISIYLKRVLADSLLRAFKEYKLV